MKLLNYNQAGMRFNYNPLQRLFAITCLVLIYACGQQDSAEYVNYENPPIVIDTLLADSLYQLSIQNNSSLEVDSFLAISEKAASIYKAVWTQDSTMSAGIRFIELSSAIGKKLRFSAKYLESISWFRETLQVGKEVFHEADKRIANANYQIGRAYTQHGDHAKSIEHLKLGLEQYRKVDGDSSKGAANCYNGLGMTWANDGYYERSLENYEHALRIRRKVYSENSRNVAACYNNIGLVYKSLGDYERARDYYKANLRILEALDNPRSTSLVNGYLNLNYVHKDLGEYQMALSYIRKALLILDAQDDVKGEYYARAHSAYGHVYDKMKQYNKGLESFKKAVEYQIAATGENNRRTATYLTGVGYDYVNLKEFEKGRKILHQALNIRRDLFPEKHWEIGKSYQNIGNAYLQEAIFDSADVYYKRSIQAFIYSREPVPLNTSLFQKSILNKQELLVSLKSLVKLRLKVFSGENSNVKRLKEALTYAELAAELMDNMRAGYDFAIQSKLAWSEEALETCDIGITVALELYKLNPDPSYLNAIYRLSEQSKATVLAQLLQESRVERANLLPEELGDQRNKLRKEIRSIEQEYGERILKKDVGKADLDNLEQKLFEARQTYEDFIAGLNESYPEFVELCLRKTTVSLPDVQSTLHQDELLLQYFYGAKEITCLIISGIEIKVQTIPVSSQFEKTLKDYRSALRSFNPARYVEQAVRLYSDLIPLTTKDDAKIHRLTIIPDGKLLQIPFEPLLSKAPQTPIFDDMDYLFRNYAIGYHYSASLFAKSRGEKRSGSLQSFAGFAPVFDDESESESSSPLLAFRSPLDGSSPVALKQSAAEVETIANFFEEPNAKIFLRKDALKEILFSREIRDKEVLHFATHGYVVDENPDMSQLLFYISDSSDVSGGILFAGETYDLGLNARLVVLSACQTGAGKLHRGEGVMALTRGFLHSGADNILLSLWNAADIPTRELMIEFYRHATKDGDFASALQKAKLTMLDKSEFSYPGYWSNFVLIGQ